MLMCLTETLFQVSNAMPAWRMRCRRGTHTRPTSPPSPSPDRALCSLRLSPLTPTPTPSSHPSSAQRIGPSGDRSITFDAIALAANLPVDQVELLIMRALSLGLIRGLLDQVEGTLRVTWVQPRVLQYVTATRPDGTDSRHTTLLPRAACALSRTYGSLRAGAGRARSR